MVFALIDNRIGAAIESENLLSTLINMKANYVCLR